MLSITRKVSVLAATLLLPLCPVLAATACSDDSEGPAGSSGGLSSNGGQVATGGARGGSGGSATGGTNTGTGGLSTSTGGTNVGTGGLASGGTKAGTGGLSSSGGTNAGSGGLANGGTNAGTGGLASGGTSAGNGGTNAGNGGTNAGNGGLASGGANAGNSGVGGSGSGPVFHIFMLMGQSNMAGVAKREASDMNTDPRLKVLGGCNQPAGQWNTATPPLNDCPGEKGWNLADVVDPGIWFAKTLLEKLPEGDTIGLVGTAESGESINTFVSGGSHHQMILNKIAKAKTAENARFAGVIFHQGESDNTQNTWPDKVVQLYDEVKEAFGVSYDVPFILGELPNGGCCGEHNVRVHEAADKLPMGYWVSQEGTAVMDEYHFNHASVVLMGKRYGTTMLEALKW
jgi:hypothetical protein